jgi:transcription elongation factor Elf1
MNETARIKEDGAKRVNARVILCRCPEARSSDNLFGIRVEECGGDWVRTWAFKLDAGKAAREGFDTENTQGTLQPTEDYPGCPYCGSLNIARCSCGKLFCWHGERGEDGRATATCPWCGQRGEFRMTEKINVRSGGF